MNAKIRMAALGVAASLAMTSAAQAALQGRDLDGNLATHEAYYDTVLDITWLADANYAKTSGYDGDGRMEWITANAWAANLSIVDTVNNITYDDWRLPTVEPVNGSTFNYNLSYIGSTDRGYNVSEQGTAFAGSIGSEMAHLFYNTLNNKGYCDPALSTVVSCSGPQAGWGLTNTGPFSNLQDGYWSATEYAPITGDAWSFTFASGVQGAGDKSVDVFALAVSTGDVGAVPEAETWAMLLAGLTLVGAAVRRRRG